LLLSSGCWPPPRRRKRGLVGEIVDPSGRAVPHATVTLLNETNAFFSSASGQDGRYLFNEVRPGRYSVTVEADGFQKIIRPAVTLAAGERIRLDFTLTIGSIEESLTIRADAPLLRTESADLGQVIDQRIIGDLPLNGRSFISLAGWFQVLHYLPVPLFPGSMEDVRNERISVRWRYGFAAGTRTSYVHAGRGRDPGIQNRNEWRTG